MKSSFGSRLQFDNFAEPLSRAPSIVDLQGAFDAIYEFMSIHLIVLFSYLLSIFFNACT